MVSKNLILVILGGLLFVINVNAGCNTDADQEPCDGLVSLDEINAYGELWYQGEIGTREFLNGMDAHLLSLPPSCGDDIINQDEDCDGSNLGGINLCGDLDNDYISGGLGCIPPEDEFGRGCKYDYSGCSCDGVKAKFRILPVEGGNEDLDQIKDGTLTLYEGSNIILDASLSCSESAINDYSWDIVKVGRSGSDTEIEEVVKYKLNADMAFGGDILPQLYEINLQVSGNDGSSSELKEDIIRTIRTFNIIGSAGVEEFTPGKYVVHENIVFVISQDGFILPPHEWPYTTLGFVDLSKIGGEEPLQVRILRSKYHEYDLPQIEEGYLEIAIYANKLYLFYVQGNNEFVEVYNLDVDDFQLLETYEDKEDTNIPIDFRHIIKEHHIRDDVLIIQEGDEVVFYDYSVKENPVERSRVTGCIFKSDNCETSVYGINTKNENVIHGNLLLIATPLSDEQIWNDGPGIVDFSDIDELIVYPPSGIEGDRFAYYDKYLFTCSLGMRRYDISDLSSPYLVEFLRHTCNGNSFIYKTPESIPYFILASTLNYGYRAYELEPGYEG